MTMPPRTTTTKTKAAAKDAAPARTTAIANVEQGIQRVADRERHPTIVAIESRMPAIVQMLPPGMNAERFASVVVQAIVKNPDILQCTPESIIASVVEAAQDGLEPTGARGGAHLVRYGNVAQLLRDYRGIIRIIIESGAASAVEAHVVRRGDHFELQYGVAEPIVHKPLIPNPDGDVLGYYALFTRPDGTKQAEFMTTDEIAAVRAKASAGSMAWKEFESQMGRKAVIKRGANYLNLRPDVRERLWREDQFEYGDEAVVSRVPATDLAERRQAIAGRTARLTGGNDSSAPAESKVREAVPSATPAPASRPADAPPCRHPSAKHTVTDAGVVCSDCGLLLAKRDEAPPAAAAATDATDDKAAIESARKHTFAVAGKRGLDGDAVKRIAAVMFAKPDERATFSRSSMSAESWDTLAKAIGSAPELGEDKTAAADTATQFAGTCAVRALPIDPAANPDPWPIIDPIVTALMDEDPASMTAGQWIEFGLRLAAGDRPAG